jgi:monoamine oxidase
VTTPVVVIGGGLAGLYTGYLLQQQNIEFKIVEASSRLGGRILSQSHASAVDNGLNVDLGPSWFWPHQSEMMALMQHLQVDYFAQYNQGEALFEADAQSPVERFQPSYMESFRVTGGMVRLIEKLAAKLPDEVFELGYKVKQIEKVDGIWQINSDDPSKLIYRANNLIIATPPRVIIDKLNLPDETLQALGNKLAMVPTWMAAQAKFVATYKQAFWREQGLSGQAFSRQGPMVEIHDSSAAENDGFALFGFIGVAASHRMQISHGDLKQACLKQLEKIFGEHALTVEESYLTDWATNDLIASPADLNEQPNHPQIDLCPYRQALIDSGLYFAASEVASRDAGYLQGAIIAATNAVGAIAENLIKNKTT